MPQLIEPATAGLTSAGRNGASPHGGKASGAASSAAARPGSLRNFLDELLAEQQTLTAVGQFARKHERHELPAQAKYYRDLIPLAKPRVGEQYSFVVDLDRCSGCKACVSACHSLNGLDENEMWRSVGLLISAPPAKRDDAAHVSRFTFHDSFQQHITTACHHCVEPGCADGCPVLAYEKDPVTGIVRHLDDQCIGCQYCVLKCPYDVPKYSHARGIVRKCDLCHDRLAAGEAPACVQACPHEAIRIEIVDQAAIAARFNGAPVSEPAGGASVLVPQMRDQEPRPTNGRHVGVPNLFLPGSPDPRITLPTTRYISSKPIAASSRAANDGALRLESPHWPLVFMLVLTQLAGGLHLLFATLFAGGWKEPLPVLALTAACALLTGLTASVAHLGRPLKAWRVFLGWRRSWMSREIIAFSVYAALAGVLIARPGNAAIAELTALAAIAGVFCSAMIYVDTRRPAWPAPVVFGQFFGTTLLLGATAGAVWSGWLAPQFAPALALLATIVRTVLFVWEWALLRARHEPASPRHWAALTVWRLLRPLLVARAILFVASTIFSIMAVLNTAQRGPIWGTLAWVTTITSQVLERYTFFAACPAPRMPGGVAA